MPLCWPQHGIPVVTEELLDETMLDESIVLPLPPAMRCPQTRARGPTSGARNSSGLLPAQRRKLRADWQLASGVFPDASFERFLYYWLVVNTRSFYFETPNFKTQPSREDRMVMVPFIDLFNHNDSGVSLFVI